MTGPFLEVSRDDQGQGPGRFPLRVVCIPRGTRYILWEGLCVQRTRSIGRCNGPVL